MPWRTVRSNTARLQTAPLVTIGAAGRVRAPEGTSSPGGPSNVLVMFAHVLDQVADICVALMEGEYLYKYATFGFRTYHSVVSSPKFSDHGLFEDTVNSRVVPSYPWASYLQSILLKPSCEWV